MLHIPYNTVGNGSKTTLFHLPVIVTRNRDCWQGFLEGYLDTDGHRFRKDGYQSYDRLASTNEDFIKEMRQFLGQKVSSNCKCMKSLII